MDEEFEKFIKDFRSKFDKNSPRGRSIDGFAKLMSEEFGNAIKLIIVGMSVNEELGIDMAGMLLSSICLMRGKSLDESFILNRKIFESSEKDLKLADKSVVKGDLDGRK